MSGRWPAQGLAWLCGYSDFFCYSSTLHLFSDVFLVGIIVTDCGTVDLTPFIFGQADVTWKLRKLVSLCSGVVITLGALWFDIRTRSEKDFAFWLYIFGVTAFWGGLSLMRSDSELNKFLYFCINMLLIFCGAALRRRVFAVFGGLGAAGYLGYLSWNVFKDSLLFPFALTFIGLGVIWMGIIWQRNENAIAQKLRGFLPQPLRDLVDRRG